MVRDEGGWGRACQIGPEAGQVDGDRWGAVEVIGHAVGDISEHVYLNVLHCL
jgi:hypothetical protein